MLVYAFKRKMNSDIQEKYQLFYQENDQKHEKFIVSPAHKHFQSTHIRNIRISIDILLFQKRANEKNEMLSIDLKESSKIKIIEEVKNVQSNLSEYSLEILYDELIKSAMKDVSLILLFRSYNSIETI